MTELADVFREFGPSYRATHKLSKQTHKVMNAIERCRTQALGGHIDECNECGHLRISYNSCRNRHCPKCQGLTKEKWLIGREKDILPVGYFHIVFTLPQLLNELALWNQREIYNLLFKASSETLIELGKDLKYLGAEIGHLSILHTWGQNLMDHPHIHTLVPAGGLSFDGTRWIQSKTNFFIPIKVISRVYRGKFMASFKDACKKGGIIYEGRVTQLIDSKELQDLINKLYQREWVVYCKAPFGNPKQVMEYLGRYTHRVAISNERILGIKQGRVRFKWKDYADQSKKKVMELEGQEFLRRFLLHVLPHNFVKIRYYGILSNRNRQTKLKLCKELFGLQHQSPKKDNRTWEEVLQEVKGINIKCCPHCKSGIMVRKESISPRADSPPKTKVVA